MNALNVIIAHRLEHAKYFARIVKNWPPSEYRVINNPDHVRGLEGVTVWILKTPRYDASYYELQRRLEIENILVPQLDRIKIKRVTLP